MACIMHQNTIGWKLAPLGIFKLIKRECYLSAPEAYLHMTCPEHLFDLDSSSSSGGEHGFQISKSEIWVDS